MMIGFGSGGARSLYLVVGLGRTFSMSLYWRASGSSSLAIVIARCADGALPPFAMPPFPTARAGGTAPRDGCGGRGMPGALPFDRGGETVGFAGKSDFDGGVFGGLKAGGAGLASASERPAGWLALGNSWRALSAGAAALMLLPAARSR